MPPRPRRDPAYYVDLGIQAVLDLLDDEYAAVGPELEAKIGERPYGGLDHPIDAHHLTTARKQLLHDNAIVEDTRITRGGRAVTVLVPADDTGRRRKIEDAAKRKRLLQTRYLTLAQGNASEPGLLGPGGEAVVHATLRAAAPYGLRLLRPEGGDIRTLFGQPVVGGSIDNGAIVTTFDPATFDTKTHLALVEVKNVRSHLYPQAQEVHQILYKAAEVVTSRPDLSMIPVLVCRWAHYTLFQMARQLGLFVIAMNKQPILPSKQLNLEHVEEVRVELGYLDLEVTDAALPWMVDRFARVLPENAETFAERWRTAAGTVKDWSRALRTGVLPARERAQAMEILRHQVGELLGEPVHW